MLRSQTSPSMAVTVGVVAPHFESKENVENKRRNSFVSRREWAEFCWAYVEFIDIHLIENVINKHNRIDENSWQMFSNACIWIQLLTFGCRFSRKTIEFSRVKMCVCDVCVRKWFCFSEKSYPIGQMKRHKGPMVDHLNHHRIISMSKYIIFSFCFVFLLW